MVLGTSCRLIWQMDWLGNARPIPIQAVRSVNPLGVKADPNAMLMPILYRNLKGESFMAMLCLDGQGGVQWQYDVGPASSWSILNWTSNQLGGATFFAQEHTLDHDDAATYVFCLDGNGQTVWTVGIAFEGKFPTAHILEQAENGDYTIWGHAQKPDNRNEHITFKPTLDANGNFISNAFKPLWGDCHRYIGGEVYAVVDPLGAATLSRFDDLPNVALDDFAVTRR